MFRSLVVVLYVAAYLTLEHCLNTCDAFHQLTYYANNNHRHRRHTTTNNNNNNNNNIIVRYAEETGTGTNDEAETSTARQESSAKFICTFDGTDFAGNVGDWPYDTSDLNRLDNSDDDEFYIEPRFVTHIDDSAIDALTNYYKSEFSNINKDKIDILDLCSSWISHLPTATSTTTTAEEDDQISYGRVVGVGMNEAELQANKQLTEYIVQDLNKDPTLSKIDDNSFDVICNVVSVDYLTRPLEIFQEMYRVLRPGGISIMSFSNRCFPTKAISMWLQADDIGRLTIVGSYFHYSANWDAIEAFDIKGEKLVTPDRPSTQDIMKDPSSLFAWMNTAAAVAKTNSGDPMFVVKGTK